MKQLVDERKELEAHWRQKYNKLEGEAAASERERKEAMRSQAAEYSKESDRFQIRPIAA